MSCILEEAGTSIRVAVDTAVRAVGDVGAGRWGLQEGDFVEPGVDGHALLVGGDGRVHRVVADVVCVADNLQQAGLWRQAVVGVRRQGKPPFCGSRATALPVTATSAEASLRRAGREQEGGQLISLLSGLCRGCGYRQAAIVSSNRQQALQHLFE